MARLELGMSPLLWVFGQCCSSRSRLEANKETVNPGNQINSMFLIYSNHYPRLSSKLYHSTLYPRLNTCSWLYQWLQLDLNFSQYKSHQFITRSLRPTLICSLLTITLCWIQSSPSRFCKNTWRIYQQQPCTCSTLSHSRNISRQKLSVRYLSLISINCAIYCRSKPLFRNSILRPHIASSSMWNIKAALYMRC